MLSDYEHDHFQIKDALVFCDLSDGKRWRIQSYLGLYETVYDHLRNLLSLRQYAKAAITSSNPSSFYYSNNLYEFVFTAILMRGITTQDTNFFSKKLQFFQCINHSSLIRMPRQIDMKMTRFHRATIHIAF